MTLSRQKLLKKTKRQLLCGQKAKSLMSIMYKPLNFVKENENHKNPYSYPFLLISLSKLL